MLSAAQWLLAYMELQLTLIRGEAIENGVEFIYLGSLITSGNDCTNILKELVQLREFLQVSIPFGNVRPLDHTVSD